MEWTEWNGKKIFLRTKHGKVYSGKIIDIDDKDKSMIFISMIDKFGDKIIFVHSEIVQIKEESE